MIYFAIILYICHDFIMMKNLVVDLGNTNLKLFVFDEGKLVYNHTKSDVKSFIVEVSRTKAKFQIKNVIISSVRNDDSLIRNLLDSLFENIVIIDSNLVFPFEIKYKTPETLGQDRLAAVSGASVLYPNKSVLVIDAGTAITYDYIEKGKIYHGGTISPGLNIRFKALHNFTGKLPLLSINKNLNADYGITTNEAITLGVQNGVLCEVKGVINAFLQKNKDLIVVFTGGDSFFFEKLIKNRIFAEPNLTAFGLNKILEINV